MSDTDPKLEAISLMRFLPAGAANIGEDVTRQDLRDADVGSWSAPCGRTDDVRPVHGAPPSSPEDPRAMVDFDEVLPLDQHEPEDEDTVIELRFNAG